MGVDSQVRPCPLCQALGRTGVLILRQINIEEAIYVCNDNQVCCTDLDLHKACVGLDLLHICHMPFSSASILLLWAQ